MPSPSVTTAAAVYAGFRYSARIASRIQPGGCACEQCPKTYGKAELLSAGWTRSTMLKLGMTAAEKMSGSQDPVLAMLLGRRFTALLAEVPRVLESVGVRP